VWILGRHRMIHRLRACIWSAWWGMNVEAARSSDWSDSGFFDGCFVRGDTACIETPDPSSRSYRKRRSFGNLPWLMRKLSSGHRDRGWLTARPRVTSALMLRTIRPVCSHPGDPFFRLSTTILNAIGPTFGVYSPRCSPRGWLPVHIRSQHSIPRTVEGILTKKQMRGWLRLPALPANR
jgi:hypothetical protein